MGDPPHPAEPTQVSPAKPCRISTSLWSSVSCLVWVLRTRPFPYPRLPPCPERGNSPTLLSCKRSPLPTIPQIGRRSRFRNALAWAGGGQALARTFTPGRESGPTGRRSGLQRYAARPGIRDTVFDVPVECGASLPGRRFRRGVCAASRLGGGTITIHI